MFNIQQQEEWDYQMGAASELQNALTLSCLERRPDDEAKVEALVAAGRFVVVCYTPAYCTRTDAIIGSRCLYLADFATRGEAVVYLATAAPEGNYDEDYRVLPLAIPPAPAYKPLTDTEVPF